MPESVRWSVIMVLHAGVSMCACECRAGKGTSLMDSRQEIGDGGIRFQIYVHVEGLNERCESEYFCSST
eukprot:5954922-Pleurochrysis_carterae.AAC.2